MKKLNILLSLVILVLSSNFSLSQYCGAATTNVAITPTTTVQYSTTYNSARRAFNFVATAGDEYTFSTVGETTVDTYLRLYSTSTGGTLLVQNDDYNNTQSEITWYCSTSGTYSVLLTRWTSSNTCANLNGNARIKYQKGNTSGSTIVSIGGGEVSDYNVPANHYYKYGWTDMIYLQSEINTVGSITKIRFQVDPLSSIPYTATNQKIYMGHTTLSSFPSSTVKENAQTNYVSSDYTLVYDGTVNWTVGWVEIVLQTPFPWNNTNNLLIKWENRHGSWTSDEPYFYYTSKTNTVAYKVLDASYPTANGVRGSLRPNIKIALADPVSLPIELLYFQAEVNERYNHLTWSTASEDNNDYFNIEKTQDGVVFYNIATINGAGNSSTQNYYEYDDYELKNNITYYRLKQTDYDGKFKYHDMISVDNREKIRIVVRIINLHGVDVDLNTKGILILIYEDGTTKKIFNE
jgi:hypothetical protein